MPDESVVDFAKKKRHIALMQKLQQGTLTAAETRELEKLEKVQTASSRQRPGVAATQEEVAAAFGVTRRTVIDWIKAGCPGTTGNYDLMQIVTWRDERDAKRRGLSTHGDDPDDWVFRYRRAKTLMAEDELAIRRKQLGRMDEFKREYGRQLQNGIYRLRGLGAKLAGMLAGLTAPQIKNLVDANASEIEDELLGRAARDFASQEAEKAPREGKSSSRHQASRVKRGEKMKR